MSRNLVNQFNKEVAGATSIEEARAIALAYLFKEIEMVSSEVKEEFSTVKNSSTAVDLISTAVSSRLESLLDEAFKGAPLFPLYIETCCSIAASKSLMGLPINDTKEAIKNSFLSKLERDGVYEV